MKKRFATIYAVACTLLMLAGFVLTFALAWRASTTDVVACLCGFVAGFALAPIAHELGHLACGKASGMRCVYWKAFCGKCYRKGGKLRFSFASPFVAEQTQMLPTRGGNMQKRASRYVLGGLLFSAVFLGVAVAAALWTGSYAAWGLLPYAGYLFLLNAAPVAYASGKTDVLAYRGIRKGEPAERCMLAAMEIQGELSEGKRFSEIDEALYFDLPTICEDEPLFAVLCDLRYRYFLDKGETARAEEWLNRLAEIEEYLSPDEVEKIAAEFVYAYTLRGDRESANAYGKGCEAYLKSPTLSAKRILAAYSAAFGNAAVVEPLKAQAEALMDGEPLGVQKLEKSLLERI